MRISASHPAAFLFVPALLLLVACGGGGTPTPQPAGPTKLGYVNNPAGTSSTWRAEVDSATNDTGTVALKVFGPSGLQIKGATVFMTCGTDKVNWAAPAGASDPHAAKGTALDLTTQGPNAAIQLFKSKLSASTTDLQVGAYQKQGSATLGTNPLFSVALAIKSGASAGKATLAPTAGKNCIYLDDAGVEHTFTLILGELTAK